MFNPSQNMSFGDMSDDDDDFFGSYVPDILFWCFEWSSLSVMCGAMFLYFVLGSDRV